MTLHSFMEELDQVLVHKILTPKELTRSSCEGESIRPREIQGPPYNLVPMPGDKGGHMRHTLPRLAMQLVHYPYKTNLSDILHVEKKKQFSATMLTDNIAKNFGTEHSFKIKLNQGSTHSLMSVSNVRHTHSINQKRTDNFLLPCLRVTLEKTLGQCTASKSSQNKAALTL